MLHQLLRGALHRPHRGACRHILRAGADAHPGQHVQLGALPLLRRHLHLPGDQGMQAFNIRQREREREF